MFTVQNVVFSLGNAGQEIKGQTSPEAVKWSDELFRLHAFTYLPVLKNFLESYYSSMSESKGDISKEQLQSLRNNFLPEFVNSYARLVNSGPDVHLDHDLLQEIAGKGNADVDYYKGVAEFMLKRHLNMVVLRPASTWEQLLSINNIPNDRTEIQIMGRIFASDSVEKILEAVVEKTNGDALKAALGNLMLALAKTDANGIKSSLTELQNKGKDLFGKDLIRGGVYEVDEKDSVTHVDFSGYAPSQNHGGATQAFVTRLAEKSVNAQDINFLVSGLHQAAYSAAQFFMPIKMNGVLLPIGEQEASTISPDHTTRTELFFREGQLHEVKVTLNYLERSTEDEKDLQGTIVGQQVLHWTKETSSQEAPGVTTDFMPGIYESQNNQVQLSYQAFAPKAVVNIPNDLKTVSTIPYAENDGFDAKPEKFVEPHSRIIYSAAGHVYPKQGIMHLIQVLERNVPEEKINAEEAEKNVRKYFKDHNYVGLADTAKKPSFKETGISDKQFVALVLAYTTNDANSKAKGVAGNLRLNSEPGAGDALFASAQTITVSNSLVEKFAKFLKKQEALRESPFNRVADHVTKLDVHQLLRVYNSLPNNSSNTKIGKSDFIKLVRETDELKGLWVRDTTAQTTPSFIKTHWKAILVSGLIIAASLALGLAIVFAPEVVIPFLPAVITWIQSNMTAAGFTFGFGSAAAGAVVSAIFIGIYEACSWIYGRLFGKSQEVVQSSAETQPLTQGQEEEEEVQLDSLSEHKPAPAQVLDLTSLSGDTKAATPATAIDATKGAELKVTIQPVQKVSDDKHEVKTSAPTQHASINHQVRMPFEPTLLKEVMSYLEPDKVHGEVTEQTVKSVVEKTSVDKLAEAYENFTKKLQNSVSTSRHTKEQFSNVLKRYIGSKFDQLVNKLSDIDRQSNKTPEIGARRIASSPELGSKLDQPQVSNDSKGDSTLDSNSPLGQSPTSP